MRFSRTLLVAVAIHATLPLAARLAPAVRVDAGIEPIIPIEVEPAPAVEERVQPPTPEAPRAEEATAASETRPEAKASPAAREARVQGDEGPAPDATSAPVAQAPTSAPKADEYGPDVRANRGSGVPGVDAPIWAVPGVIGVPSKAAPAPTVAAAAPTTPRDQAGVVIRDGLKTHDKAVGIDLPGAGTVATAVRDVVQSSDAPMTSRASFQVRVGPGGNVLGVTLGAMSGGSSEVWKRIASAIAAALKAKVLAMPSEYAKGATITVAVSSDALMPDGTAGGGVTPSGAGFGFDLANVGAHKRRVVRSTFTVAPVQ